MGIRYIFFGLIFLVAAHADAGTTALEVKSIQVTGQKKTREVVILRELDFAVGDTISQAELAQRLERNRTNLLNTALFTEVELNIAEWNHDASQIVVTIHVKEAWYLYVVPIIELADRNFNVWWQEHNRSFKRLNIGIYSHHINLTGSRDKLKVKGQLGYTPKFDVNYLLPYFNRDKSIGATIGAIWSSNREVAYISEGNKQLFYKDDTKSVFRRFKFQTGVTYRPNLYLSHDVDIAFHSNKIDRRIALDNNPDFFLLGRSEQNYFSLRYRGTYDARDLQLFPMRGVLCGVEITKEGLGAQDDVNSLTLTPFFELHVPITKNISVSSQSKAQYGVIREKQPFWNYQGLGYGRDYLRGYELYIIHGLDYVYTKTSVRARIVNGNVNWKKKMPRAFREMPYQFYLTANYDFGYANDPFYAEGNPLVNRPLYGGGPGIALVVYHTFSLHVEYNYNHLGENGLFLHTKTSF